MSPSIPPFIFEQGTAPLLISMPHTGTHVPADIAAKLTPAGREVHDTDWHMPRLYDFARELGASIQRLTGGYITRHHGQPAQGFHAV